MTHPKEQEFPLLLYKSKTPLSYKVELYEFINPVFDFHIVVIFYETLYMNVITMSFVEMSEKKTST